MADTTARLQSDNYNHNAPVQWLDTSVTPPVFRIVTPAYMLPITEPAIQGSVAMTVGTSYAVGRQIFINCSVAGNVSLTFADGSILVVPVLIGPQSFPYAISAVNASGTTATATYASLK